jgi:hypothetical protein
MFQTLQDIGTRFEYLIIAIAEISIITKNAIIINDNCRNITLSFNEAALLLSYVDHVDNYNNSNWLSRSRGGDVF